MPDKVMFDPGTLNDAGDVNLDLIPEDDIDPEPALLTLQKYVDDPTVQKREVVVEDPGKFSSAEPSRRADFG